MAELLRPDNGDDLQDSVHQAVQRLAGGEVVGIVTDAGYLPLALATSQSAVEKLDESNAPLVLMARTTDEAFDFVPELSRIGCKLARRLWPGPIVLGAGESAVQGGLLPSLPESTRTTLLQHGMQVSVASGELIEQLGRLVSAPLVAAIPRQVVESADEIASTFPCVSLAIQAGDVRFPDGLTFVSLAGENWTVTREGVVRKETVQRMTAEVVIFVCTGNTCRSPLAEALLRGKLTQRLQCSLDDLPERGWYVSSAGLAAGYGSPASPESVQLAREHGVDLTPHESQPLTERLLNHADFVYTMTRGHRDAILSRRPDLAHLVQLLARDGSDVPDPIGSGFEEYQRCCQSIEKHLDEILSQFSLS
ncbi:hypothetical protein GC176_17375 [bacterium]|nr:hypothetical protein [bacterium]